jgi:hypothetical protein
VSGYAAAAVCRSAKRPVGSREHVDQHRDEPEAQQAGHEQHDEPGLVGESRGVHERADPGDELAKPAGDEQQPADDREPERPADRAVAFEAVTSDPENVQVPVQSTAATVTSASRIPAMIAARLPTKMRLISGFDMR